MEIVLGLVILGTIAYFGLRFIRSGRRKISLDHLPDKFVVLDLETTGLDAARHEIIEVAAIRYEKGGTSHEYFQSLVIPQKTIPKRITELTGISQKMVEQDGKQLIEVLQALKEFAGTERLVTFNAEFDMAFLHAACEMHSVPRLSNPVSCVLEMARRAWPSRRSYKLADLAADGEFVEGRGHRALEDARRAIIVYAAATEELRTVA